MAKKPKKPKPPIKYHITKTIESCCGGKKGTRSEIIMLPTMKLAA